jgi:hypothetical protein
VRRLGLFIGNDKGLAGELTLKFASRDAREMAGLFSRSGLYGSDRVILLENAGLSAVKKAMNSVDSMMQSWKRVGFETHFLVYFSGHGDSDALHIRGEKLLREELIRWLGDSRSDLKIAILDACESGNFLRSKGGHFIQDIPVRIESNLNTHGTIVLSSTSRGELAQESEEYRGAVFTHHLMNGLRGLADYNGDGWVGLQEAFDYSRRATVTDVTLGTRARQNPTFDLDLVGGNDPGLVPLDRKKSWMVLRGFPAGTLEIFDAHSLNLVARLWLTGRESLSYGILTGRYLFRFNENGKDYLHTSEIGREGGIHFERGQFREKMRWTSAAKGGIPAVRLSGLQLSWVSPEPFANFPLHMTRGEFILRTADYKQELSLGYGWGSYASTATELTNQMQIFRVGYALRKHLWDASVLGLWGGVSGAWHGISQRVMDQRVGGGAVQTREGFAAPKSWHWANLYQAGMPLELEIFIYSGIWVSTELMASLYAYRDHASGEFAFRGSLDPSLSLGVHF